MTRDPGQRLEDAPGKTCPGRVHDARVMRPPFFILEVNGDVTACDTAAESAGESIDVEDGEYRAVYDTDGLLLDLHVAVPTKRHKWRWFPWVTSIELTPVRLRPLEATPTHQKDLHAALREALARRWWSR